MSNRHTYRSPEHPKNCTSNASNFDNSKELHPTAYESLAENIKNLRKPDRYGDEEFATQLHRLYPDHE